jgi:Fe-S-cluster-containing dehydrogenase component
MGDNKAPVKLPVLGAESSEDGFSRRRFLAMFGASAALATGAGCKPPKDRAGIVPYTKKQEEIVPGIADYYASTFQEGDVAFPVLVKAREGRPIHVDGNDEHPRYRGKTSFHATADLLGLYDADRLRAPVIDGQPGSWQAAIAHLASAIKGAISAGKGVVLVTETVLSPTRKALIAKLGEAVPGLRHLAWEPGANHNGLAVERELLGEARLAQHHLDRASVVVTLEADILGTLGDAAAAIAGFAAKRRPSSASGPMNRLYAIEGGMSLTGSRADVRIPLRPSALAKIAFGLVRAVHVKSGRALPAGVDAAALEPFALERLAEAKPFTTELDALVADLSAAGEKSLVLAGPAAPREVHAACLLLNRMLGTEGVTLTSDQAVAAPALATPADVQKLIADMAAGQVAVAMFWGGNPAYDMPQADEGGGNSPWQSALAKVPSRVRLGLIADETAEGCNLVLPTNHWLESWNDFETSRDVLTLQQPVIAPLYDTLQGEDVLLRCLAELGRPLAKTYHEFLKQRWQAEVAPKSSPVPFERFWNVCLHDGLLHRKAEPSAARTLDGAACGRAIASAGKSNRSALELILDLDPRIYDGRYANNGWLQEMPDPVTRTSWGSPLCVSLADADRLGLKNGDLVSLGRGPVVPILRQPGQAEGVLRVTLGHGRWRGSVATRVGARAWAFAPAPGARLAAVESIQPTGGRADLALAQDHDTRDGRDIARQWTVREFAKRMEHAEREHAEHEEIPSLYAEHEHKGPRWGMAIDLSACVGCGACVVACQSENNIPVVGPEQVSKGRAMHWMRVDRYYEGEGDKVTAIHEPMLCQQCDNAPCETVCPVQATNHGPDGINQMAYNRCVGTRYCANNCPYKVRRFNFLDFTSETPESLQLAFNPEVSVRPRGVMEKCNFCVQRVNNAKQVVKREGRELRDGDITPACGASCPASAIVFGDLNDPQSQVSKLSRNKRGFHVLEELGTKPAITYLAAIKNPAGKGEG